MSLLPADRPSSRQRHLAIAPLLSVVLVTALLGAVLTQVPVQAASPVAYDDTVNTDEDTPRAIILNASDTDGDSLTFSIVTQPANGSLSGSAPNVTYTPYADFNGSDSFAFQANDGTQDSNTATVSITVNPIEDAPVADNQQVVTPQDTPLAFTLSAHDPDGDSITYSLVTTPTNGVLAGTLPNLAYTPNPGFSGTDSCSFRVNDGDQDSNTATVSIAVSDPPVADPQTVGTNEDTSLPIVLTASDREGDSLTYSIAVSPPHGMIAGFPPSIIYTPDTDYNGSDSFAFAANDGHSDSAPATIAITIAPLEDAPVAPDQSVFTDEDTPVAFTLNASDADGDPLTFIFVSFPANGVLSGSAPNLTYTPNANYNGSDGFTYMVNDGKQDSAVAVVSIIIQPVDDPPVADAQTINAFEDTPQLVVLTATDIDSAVLSYYVTDVPISGTLSGTAPNLTYTPNPDYYGSDSFGFRANDGTSDSATAWISIQIAPVNDPPAANEMSVMVTEDTFQDITLTGSDVEGDPLTYSIAVAPTYGTLTGSAPQVTYTPFGNYYGADSFTFVVSDTAGLTDTAQVSITVTNVNDPPLAVRDRVTVNEDSGSNSINLVQNDTYLPDPPETLTIVSATAATHGSVVLQPGGSYIAYTPNANYYGPDTFDYTINDGNGGSATATVVITVTNVNDPPLALPDNVEMDEDSGSIEITVLDNDTWLPDPEEDLVIVSISDAAHGAVTLASDTKSLFYTPDQDFNGSDLFTYRISDRHGMYNTAIVRVTVYPVNDRPIAKDDQAGTAEDTPVTIDVLANDEDIDLDNALDPASVRVIAGPNNGTTSVNLTNGRITYYPAPNWYGIDTLTYRVCDNAAAPLCDGAQVTVSVGSVNDPPVSDAGPDQTVSTNARVTLDGSGSYDPDNNLPLAYRWIQLSGTPVVLTDETAESPSFVAPDDPSEIVFMLRVIDYNGQGKADLTPDQVVISVKNQPPISNAGPDIIEQADSPVTLDGTASTDPDGDLPLQYLWTQIGGPSVVLTNATSATPSFTTPSVTTVLTFMLFVTDALGEPDRTPDQVIVTVKKPHRVYMPSVFDRYVIAPDLVVESLTATSRNVELVIRNQGNAPVANAFWVDVYINPTRPPTAVNETFADVGPYGLAWAVVGEGVGQLVPGGSLTLRMYDAYYSPRDSVFPGSLPAGAPIYAQVDSFNPNTSYGTVLEDHEVMGEPYNNICGPVISKQGAASGSEMPPNVGGAPTPSDLPKRH